MSDDFVTFNIRHGKSLFELKIKFPGDVSGFIEILKNELKFEETDELIILCPTPGGKMMEIQSDDDFKFLKKTKLAYNAVTKEIYCNVELVVTVIHELPDDTKAQFMMLSKKIDKLASKIDVISDDLTKKIDENKTSNCSKIRSILAENFDLRIDSGNNSKNNSLSEEVIDPRKKSKKNKKKLSSTARTNDNSLTEENQQYNYYVLLEMLKADGYTNTLQNIIVLKRYDSNYEKAKKYLSSSVTQLT